MAGVETCRGFALTGLEVSVPVNPSAMEILAVLYGIVPWVGGICVLAGGLWKRTSTMFCAIILGAAMIIINEGIIKQIVKEARPMASCLKSNGMPSSHSMLAFGFITWVGLECMYHHHDVPRLSRLGIWLVLCSLLVPVPAARVRVEDHTPLQVCVGILCGVLIACPYFILLHLKLGIKFEMWCDHRHAKTLGIRNTYVMTIEQVVDEQTDESEESRSSASADALPKEMPAWAAPPAGKSALASKSSGEKSGTAERDPLRQVNYADFTFGDEVASESEEEEEERKKQSNLDDFGIDPDEL